MIFSKSHNCTCIYCTENQKSPFYSDFLNQVTKFTTIAAAYLKQVSGLSQYPRKIKYSGAQLYKLRIKNEKTKKNELFSFIRTTGNENQRWLDGDSRQKSYIIFWKKSNFFSRLFQPFRGFLLHLNGLGTNGAQFKLIKEVNNRRQHP